MGDTVGTKIMTIELETLYDTAEEITKSVMELLAPTTPVEVSDGGNDPASLTYSNEARAVYDTVLSILERKI